LIDPLKTSFFISRAGKGGGEEGKRKRKENIEEKEKRLEKEKKGNVEPEGVKGNN
jgi:hypothetical protein